MLKSELPCRSLKTSISAPSPPGSNQSGCHHCTQPSRASLLRFFFFFWLCIKIPYQPFWGHRLSTWKLGNLPWLLENITLDLCQLYARAANPSGVFPSEHFDTLASFHIFCLLLLPTRRQSRGTPGCYTFGFVFPWPLPFQGSTLSRPPRACAVYGSPSGAPLDSCTTACDTGSVVWDR